MHPSDGVLMFWVHDVKCIARRAFGAVEPEYYDNDREEEKKE
jgi:hypothetical protein